MKVIKSVNGIEPIIQPCDDYSITRSDLYSDSTGRTSETGELIAYLIRSGVYNIHLTFKGTIEEISEIEELFSHVSLNVEFAFLGKYQSAKMYPADRTAIQTGESYAEISFSLVEY